MADSVTLAQLKTSRADAKRAFQRQANDALRMLCVLTEQELRDTFRSLTSEANKVLEANEEVEEQSSLEGALSPEQRRELDKVSSDTEERLAQLKESIAQTLWEKFGEEEVSLVMEAGEEEVERAEAVTANEDREVFEFRLEHLGELVSRAKHLHTAWRSWAPPEKQQQLQSRVRDLERALLRLTARKAEFIKVKGKNKARSTSTSRKAATNTTTTGPSSSSADREAPPTSSGSSSSPGRRAVRVSLPDPGDQTEAAVEMVERLLKESDLPSDSSSPPAAGSSPPGPGSSPPACVVCGHSKHGLRLYFCRKFQALRLKEKQEAVRRLGACRRCLELHQEAQPCKTEFLCQREECGPERHHYSLCPKKERPRTFTAVKNKVSDAQGGGARPSSYLSQGGGARPQSYLSQGGGAKPPVYAVGGAKPLVYSRGSAVGGARPQSYSRAQQEFVKKLPPELAKEFKQVFRSSAPRTANSHSANTANSHSANTANNHSAAHSMNHHSAPRSAQPSGGNAPGDRAFRGFRGWTQSQF